MMAAPLHQAFTDPAGAPGQRGPADGTVKR